MAVNIIIRNATIDECPMIASVLKQSFIEYEPLYTPDGFAATTPTSDQIIQRWNEGPVWVALQNENIIGTVAAVPENGGLYVRSMAILPYARGQGIATKLLNTVEGFALDHHYKNLFLSTTPFLKEAISLYESFGFKRIEEPIQDLFGTPLFGMLKQLEIKINE